MYKQGYKQGEVIGSLSTYEINIQTWNDNENVPFMKTINQYAKTEYL